MLIKPHVLAYYNHGRWVGDCPSNCGSATLLKPGESSFFCHECKYVSKISWPHNTDEIMEALAMRSKQHQNWFPTNHDLALRFGLPHGQTVEELREETEANRGVD